MEKELVIRVFLHCGIDSLGRSDSSPSLSLCAVHWSDPGRARGRAGHGGRSQRDLGTERDGRGAGRDHYPEFPAAQRLLLLLVLLLQLLMVGDTHGTHTARTQATTHKPNVVSQYESKRVN